MRHLASLRYNLKKVVRKPEHTVKMFKRNAVKNIKAKFQTPRWWLCMSSPFAPVQVR